MAFMSVNPIQVSTNTLPDFYDNPQSEVHSLIKDINGNLIGVKARNDSSNGKVVWSNDGGATWSESTDQTATAADNAGAGARHAKGSVQSFGIA